MWTSTALRPAILPAQHSGYSAVTLSDLNDASKGGQDAFPPKRGPLQGKPCIRLAEATLLLGAGDRDHLPSHLLFFGHLYQQWQLQRWQCKLFLAVLIPHMSNYF